jgi:hypothetical protein
MYFPPTQQTVEFNTMPLNLRPGSTNNLVQNTLPPLNPFSSPVIVGQAAFVQAQVGSNKGMNTRFTNIPADKPIDYRRRSDYRQRNYDAPSQPFLVTDEYLYYPPLI